MQVIINLQGLTTEELLETSRDLLEVVVKRNRARFRAAPFPSLYESGVRFRPEPWAGRMPNGARGVEHFARAEEVLARGWGDCAQLCAWRVAELRNMGEKADFHFSVELVPMPDGNTATMMHCMVERANGYVEDPSRYLA